MRIATHREILDNRVKSAEIYGCCPSARSIGPCGEIKRGWYEEKGKIEEERGERKGNKARAIEFIMFAYFMQRGHVESLR